MGRLTLRDTSAAELDALATITTRDIDDAAAAWDRDATPAFRGLLDARPDTGAAKIDAPLKLGKVLPPEV